MTDAVVVPGTDVALIMDIRFDNSGAGTAREVRVSLCLHFLCMTRCGESAKLETSTRLQVTLRNEPTESADRHLRTTAQKFSKRQGHRIHLGRLHLHTGISQVCPSQSKSTTIDIRGFAANRRSLRPSTLRHTNNSVLKRTARLSSKSAAQPHTNFLYCKATVCRCSHGRGLCVLAETTRLDF